MYVTLYVVILQLLSYLTIEASVLDSLSVQFSNTISPNHKSSCSPLLKSKKGPRRTLLASLNPKNPLCGAIYVVGAYCDP